MKQEIYENYPVETTDMVSDIGRLLVSIESSTDDYTVHRTIALIRDELLLIQKRENDWVEATGYFNPAQYDSEHGGCL